MGDTIVGYNFESILLVASYGAVKAGFAARSDWPRLQWTPRPTIRAILLNRFPAYSARGVMLWLALLGNRVVSPSPLTFPSRLHRVATCGEIRFDF